MMPTLPTALFALWAVQAAAPPKVDKTDEQVFRLGAIFAGGVLDLMTDPKRDVTASFAAIVSAPIGYGKEKRAAEFTMLSTGLSKSARVLNKELAADLPTLVALCSKPGGGSSWKLEAVLSGTSRVWTLAILADSGLFGTPAGPTHPPQFIFASLNAFKGTPEQRLLANAASGSTCRAVKRDAAGEAFFEGEAEPVRFQASPGTPFAAGSDHLLDFADEPDTAVEGLMPAEVFANLHGDLPRPRAAGVLSLATTADALSVMGRLTLVATSPTAPATAVLFVDGRDEILRIGFKNGYFTTPQVVAPLAALAPERSGRGDQLTSAWSKWSWSLVEPRMPAEILLDMTPPAASCLEGLPKVPDEGLATKIQQCLDLSLADAGPSFRVRRERWLLDVRAHEDATAAKVDSFCADQGALAAVPFFQRAPGGKNRDAGPLLTATLGWEKRKGAKDLPGSLKLPADLDQKFSVSGFMELSNKDLAAAAAADTSFFTRLGDFERWELADGIGPLVAASTLNASEAALPEFGRLSLAARLHLRRAVKTGKLVQAARHVRSAARLAFSTENYVGQFTGLSLLTTEWRAWEWAQKHQLKTTGWTPVDEVTLERARRVVRTASAFFSPMTKEDTFARAMACDQVTSCAAITEVVAVSAGLDSLLREPWRTRLGGVLKTIAAPTDRCSFALARHWAGRPLVDLVESKRSRNQEVIAGGVMSRAAGGFYLPALERFYPH